MFTSADLKATITLIRPIIERQLDDAEVIAGHREQVTAQGGDWSQVKALVKAMIQDERDEAGGHKRVMAILHKADNALGYADMLGLGNLNEKNSFGDLPSHDPVTGEILDPSLHNPQGSSEPSNMHDLHNAPEATVAESAMVATEPAAADEATLTPVKAGQASQQGGEEPGTLGSLSAAPSNIVRIQAKPLRPYCHPDHTGVCASPGGKVHCHRCETFHAAGAREVVAGGKQIEHHGSINQ